ncbi:hypothetical protein Golob_001036, partial [Gossypium lobatum]|nr:hypothetical protein [Gossypium lobatum]
MLNKNGPSLFAAATLACTQGMQLGLDMGNGCGEGLSKVLSFQDWRRLDLKDGNQRRWGDEGE